MDRVEVYPTEALRLAADVVVITAWASSVSFHSSSSDAANDGPAIKRAADALFGRDVPPVAILLTHVHPDHAGSALVLARTWDCPVYVHSAAASIATLGRLHPNVLAGGHGIPLVGSRTSGTVSAFAERM